MRTSRIACILAIGALLVACSTDDDAAVGDANVVNVDVSSNQFTPASVKVKVGQTVRWTWRGGAHNVVSGPDCDQPDGLFKSGEPQSGGTFERRFDQAGTFPYYCDPHCRMGQKGEVVVEP